MCNEEGQVNFGKYGIHTTTSIIFSSAFLHLTLNYAQKFQAFEKINRQGYAKFHKGSTYLAIASGLFIEGLHHVSPQAFKNYLSTDHKFEFLFGSSGFIRGFFHPKAAGGDDITWENFSNLVINKKSWAWAITAGGFGRTTGIILDDWVNLLGGNEKLDHDKSDSKKQKTPDTNGLSYEELKRINQNLEELKNHMIKATSQQPSEPKEPL